MKKFHFTLQALQTLRERQEKSALELYAQAVTARQLALENLESVMRHCEESWSFCRAEMARGAEAAQIARMEAYCRTVEEQRARCAAEAQAAQRVMDQRWQKLVLARRDREAVERYRDHQHARYERELQRDEQKALDDLAGRRGSGEWFWKLALNEGRN